MCSGRHLVAPHKFVCKFCLLKWIIAISIAREAFFFTIIVHLRFSKESFLIVNHFYFIVFLKWTVWSSWEWKNERMNESSNFGLVIHLKCQHRSFHKKWQWQGCTLRERERGTERIYIYSMCVIIIFILRIRTDVIGLQNSLQWLNVLTVLKNVCL